MSTRLITDLEGINCDNCGTFIKRGEDAYELGCECICEDCFDRYQIEEKKEARRTVNSYNFDLEKEG